MRAWLAVIAFAFASPAAAQLVLPQPELRTVQDCADCPELVVLPDGSLMSRAPVQKGEFAVFVEETKYRHTGWGCKWRHAHIEQTDEHPAVCITYKGAQAYVNWLNERSGKSYRLPSADELTYAIMGFASSNYWWGEQIGEGRANCTGCGSPFDGVGTSPVDAFPPNDWGLLDAIGNVWIWTTDCESEACEKRALLSGGWSSPPSDLRVTKRIFQAPNVPFNSYGFRVVRDPD